MNPEEETLPVTYGDPDNPITDPTPDDPLTKDDILIYNLEQLLKELKEYHGEDQASLSGMDQKLQQLLDQGSSGDSSFQTGNEQTLAKLETISQQISEVQTGSNTIVTYGVLYIPFAIIVFLFWRFFRTFLRSAT